MPPPLDPPGSPAGQLATSDELRRPSAGLISAVVVVGVANLALSVLMPLGHHSVERPLAYQVGERVGQVAGIFAIAAVVCGIFAIWKRFRTARSQCIILLVLLSLTGLGAVNRLAATSKGRETETRDRQVMAQLQARNETLRQQLAESTDPDELVRLQAELRANLEKSLEQLSPDYRASMLVATALTDPFMDEAQACARAVADFLNSPDAQGSTAVSPAELESRIAQVDAVLEAIRRLQVRMDAMPDEVRRLKGQVRSRREAEALRGAADTLMKKMPDLRQLYKVQFDLYSGNRASFVLLRDQWGNWSRDEAGVIVWNTEELLDQFQQVQEKIIAASEEQERLRSLLLAPPEPPKGSRN
jgi:hypothetical protein